MKFSNILLIVIIGIISIYVIYFVIDGFTYIQSTKSLIIKNETCGKINQILDLGRGYSIIKVKNNTDSSSIELPFSWEINHYKIKLGDSVSKKANDINLKFYKNINKKMRYSFTYEIY
jgi:hypothetical protein